MACCYIAAFCVGQLVKTCQFLDLDQGIRYNDELDPTVTLERGHDDGARDTTDKPAAYNHGKTDDQTSAILSIDGMTCSACVQTVTAALERLEEVKEVRTSLQTNESVVISDGKKPLDATRLVDAVREAGYEARLGPRTHSEVMELLKLKKDIALLKESFSGLARYGAVLQVLAYTSNIVGGWASQSSKAATLAGILRVALALIAVMNQYQYALWIHSDCWRLLRRRHLNMNSLISLSTLVGLVFTFLDILVVGPLKSTSYAMTTSGLTLVVVAGRYLDILSRRQASKHLVKLYEGLSGQDYVQLQPGGKKVPSSFLRPGDTIKLDPFCVVPCDCYVVEGTSTVNQSLITGEALPITKSLGDSLLAGTQNLNGSLSCVVNREREESFYAQLVRSVSEAGANKIKGQDVIDTVTRWFSLVVVLLAFSSPTIELYYQQKLSRPVGFYVAMCRFVERVMTILVSACPCALGLAVPSAVVASIDAAHSKGILLTKGVSTLQELERVDQMVFDKTGTLTEGNFEVESITMHPAWKGKEAMLWTLVCALEEHEANGHPIGVALFKKGLQETSAGWLKSVARPSLSDTVSVPGRGVAGKVGIENAHGSSSRHRVCIGNQEFLRENSVASSLDTESVKPQVPGIAVHIGVDGILVATIQLQDQVKPEARETLRTLVDRGYGVSMLTGDAEAEASRVASRLGIPILASRASPADKLEHIRSLQKAGSKVAMIGDGLNDAPSLAASDVGIIMTCNSSAATVGGSVMILNSGLGSLPLLGSIVKITMRQIRWNIIWAVCYNVIALSLATGILMPLGYTLKPSFGAGLMSMSSVMITMQSLWLRSRLLEKDFEVKGKE
ncbi:hypothetical protein LTS17_000608 [Exophiala oligosperma]